MKKIKNNLDEMQEQKLLQIEHNGCWLAFWGLLLAMLVQCIIYKGAELRALTGEWIVFMALCAYILVSCLKNGIWDRHLKASPKVNLLCSAAAALTTGVVFFFATLRNYGDIRAAVLTAALALVMVFVLCFGALTLGTLIYKKRVNKMENEDMEERENDNKA